MPAVPRSRQKGAPVLMPSRHSIKARALCVTAVVILLQTAFSARTLHRVYEEARVLRINAISQGFEVQSQNLDRHVLLLQKSLQLLSLQGEQHLTLPKQWRPDPERFVRRVLEESPEAVGGGIWYEPYMDVPSKLRSCVYFLRSNGQLRLDPFHESGDYDYPGQMWYAAIKARARSSLDVIWTPPYLDKSSVGETLMVTLGSGLFYDDTLVGMVTLDWELSDMLRRLGDLLPTPGSFALFADMRNDMVLVNTAAPAGGFGQSARALPWMPHVGAGLSRFTLDGVDCMALMHTMENGMALLLVIPETELLAPVRHSMRVMLGWQTGFTLLLLGVLWLLLHRFITAPVLSIVDKAQRIGSGDLDARIPIIHKGELGSLAHVLNTMTENLQAHMRAMGRLTQERERMAAELDIAAHIQAAMLPQVFPAFPHRTEFALRALMRPAREVGGDYYDFFLVDENHLALIIADVSGKGVPAALFMVVVKTLLKNLMRAGLTPGAALSAANDQLCENNPMDMFVTVWAGLLTLHSGHLRHGNAGHNKPLLGRAGGVFAPLEGRRGFVLGGLPGTRYAEDASRLVPGDRLLLYTDGITEAENPAQEQFGLQRLRRCADAARHLPPEATPHAVTAAVDAFAEGAPQTDDITLLLLDYAGPPQERRQLLAAWEARVPAVLDICTPLRDRLEETLTHCGCPARECRHLLLALEEIFVNIASYAYAPAGHAASASGSGAPGSAGPPDSEVTLRCEVERLSPDDAEPAAVLRCVLRFRDYGVPFNPLTHTPSDVTQPAEERAIGGLGIQMTRRLMHSMTYERAHGQNILTLTKEWAATGASDTPRPTPQTKETPHAD